MELIADHSFGIGTIVHKRTRDTKNFFKYNAPYLCLNLSQPGPNLAFFSWNRFNLFSIFYRQHGFRDKDKNLLEFAQQIASQHQIQFDSVHFICIPSIVGYSFNPISFYLFLNQAKQPIAILYEVKNTFGDQVHYLSAHDFSKSTFKKNMYVSPFIEMDCTYEIFSKLQSPRQFFCSIHQFDSNQKQIFYASINLPLAKITFFSTLVFILFNILGSIKTITLIHYQAFKLWLKKSQFFKYSKRVKDRLYFD